MTNKYVIKYPDPLPPPEPTYTFWLSPAKAAGVYLHMSDGDTSQVVATLNEHGLLRAHMHGDALPDLARDPDNRSLVRMGR